MSERTLVRFQTARDEDASTIAAVLEALGYEASRVMPDGDPAARAAWAVERMTKQHLLAESEAEVVTGVVDGLSNDDIAACLGVSRATVKWRMHNVFIKTNTANREGLLRLALNLAPAGSL